MLVNGTSTTTRGRFAEAGALERLAGIGLGDSDLDALKAPVGTSPLRGRPRATSWTQAHLAYFCLCPTTQYVERAKYVVRALVGMVQPLVLPEGGRCLVSVSS